MRATRSNDSEAERLLDPHRLYWVNAGRSAGGSVGGEKCRKPQGDRRQYKRTPGAGFHSDDPAFEQAGETHREHDPADDTDGGSAPRVPQHHGRDRSLTRAQRHTNPDLSGALTHNLRHHAIEPDRG